MTEIRKDFATITYKSAEAYGGHEEVLTFGFDGDDNFVYTTKLTHDGKEQIIDNVLVEADHSKTLVVSGDDVRAGMLDICKKAILFHFGVMQNTNKRGQTTASHYRAER